MKKTTGLSNNILLRLLEIFFKELEESENVKCVRSLRQAAPKLRIPLMNSISVNWHWATGPNHHAVIRTIILSAGRPRSAKNLTTPSQGIYVRT